MIGKGVHIIECVHDHMSERNNSTMCEKSFLQPPFMHITCMLRSYVYVWRFLDAAVDNYSSLQSLQEAALIGVDSLGFDVKVCSGTQVQTLRFAFNTRVWQLFFS